MKQGEFKALVVQEQEGTFKREINEKIDFMLGGKLKGRTVLNLEL